MKIGFDIISDLNLTAEDTFDWSGKSTSLYCIVSGNLSNDIKTIANALMHLTKHYHGVFYIAGPLEFEGMPNISKRANEISRLCNKIKNVAFLYHNVVIIDGVAILGANGWYGEITDQNAEFTEMPRYEDLAYLKNSIEKLQKHLDVKKILVATGSVPNDQLYFGEIPKNVNAYPEMSLTLMADLEGKVSHWAFGTHKKIVDTNINGINYINNPSCKTSPYWAKRIEIEV